LALSVLKQGSLLGFDLKFLVWELEVVYNNQDLKQYISGSPKLALKLMNFD
jgi:hypothetical protein